MQAVMHALGFSLLSPQCSTDWHMNAVFAQKVACLNIIMCFQGATTDRDGQKIRVFTKRDYRNLADV